MSLPALFSGLGLGAALPVPRLIRPRIRTSKRLLPLRVYRRQEIGTSATLENPLSSCRHLASFAACNPRELVFFFITLRQIGGGLQPRQERDVRSIRFRIPHPGCWCTSRMVGIGWKGAGAFPGRLPWKAACRYGHRANHALRLPEYCFNLRGLRHFSSSRNTVVLAAL